ncbi:hypothetical protein QEN19_002454 [Hanseniaspora menglaensis]
MDFGPGKIAADGKVTKKKESKKQELLDIVSHIDNLEAKINLLLKGVEMSKQHQNDSQLDAQQTPSVPNDIRLPFSPSGLSPLMEASNTALVNEKEALFENKNNIDNMFSKHPTSDKFAKISSKNTPLNFLADVISNQQDQNVVSEKILLEEQKATPQSISSVNSVDNSDSIMTNVSSDPPNLIHVVSNNDLNIKNAWSKFRSSMPPSVLPLFDSISIDDMFTNSKKVEKIYKIVETTEIKVIPDIKIIEKMIDIFINTDKVHVLLPLESFDLLGILGKWKFEGFKSLNHSHLLILNVVGSFMCKQIRTSIFLKNDIKGIEIREKLNGFDNTLLNHFWLSEWENFFLANALLHYQSIIMFPDGLASVQGIILLLTYIPLTGLNLSESLMQTTAIRICQDLGLHSERFLSIINKNKKMLRDKKKKIWWFCCFSDELLSMIFLKPRMIVHYTSSIQFRNDDKTKVLELLDQELDKELMFQKLREKNAKFYDEDNSEVIENLKTQINDTIIRIYKEDGIFSILKYYFFTMTHLFQKNVTKMEKKWDATVLEAILEDFIHFSDNLPSIIKNPELMKDIWGEDLFFVYLIHVTVFFIQDYSYSLLYSTKNSREYIDFIKQHLDVLLKTRLCKGSYNAMFGVFDEAIFSKFMKIIQYHLDSEEFSFSSCVQDYSYIKTYLNEYLGDPDQQENNKNSDEDTFVKDTIQDLDPWLAEKKTGFYKLLEMLKLIGLLARRGPKDLM